MTPMRRWSAARAVALVAASAAVWAVLAGACLFVGSTGRPGVPTRGQLPYRLDAVLLASLIGATLAAAGVVYQAVLRNPLADPGLLGISSGASLAAYLWQVTPLPVLLMARTGEAGVAASQQAFAFAGAIVSMVLVFALAADRGGRLDRVTLLLVGVVVNAVYAATYLLLNAIQKDRPASGSPLLFLVGGVNTSITTQQELFAAGVAAAGWLALFYLAGQLNTAALADAEAEALGVRAHRLRWASLVVASLMTGAAVALGGPIAFIGLVCPHLARLLVGPDTRKLLPTATALGGGVLALADAGSRYLAADTRAQTLLPAGVLTGFLGGPFFLFLVWRSRRRPPEGAGT